MRQFLHYFAVAAAGVLLDWAVFALLLALGSHPALAQAISRACGALMAFLGFRHVAFGSQAAASPYRQAFRFLVAATLACMMSVGLVWILARICPVWAAKGGTDLMTFTANWFVMRLYVFGEPRREALK